MKNLDDLNIFYGENEAGKSTIMSFIHSVFFGFPTRQQTELRYEPKKLAKYGGQLIATFPSGKAVIERVKGKATGDVKVLMEDGTQGGEELLKELLSNMDKNLFQSIFSFNLHGLQNIQQMKNEDLGKFLFSTGTLGTDRLLATETFLQKRLDSLYKQSGKKPVINEKLAEIKLLSQDLKKAEQHNDQYWQYLEEKETLEAKLAQLQLQTSELQGHFTRMQEWKRLLPFINEENALQDEWVQIANTEFPNDGISHLDDFKKMLIPYENKLGTLTSRIKDLENEIKNSEPNPELLAHEVAIYTAVENLPLYEQLKQESNQLALNLTDLHMQISELQQNLHIALDESMLKNSDTSVFMREKTADAQRKAQRLKEKKQELDEQFQQTKQDLEEMEAQIGHYNEILLSDMEREEVIQQKSLAENRSQYEKELAEIQNQKRMINNLQIQETQQGKLNKRQSLLQLVVLTGIFVLLAGWGFVEKQWVVFAIAMAGFLYLFIFRNRKPSARKGDFQTELTSIKEKETVLTNKLDRTLTKSLDSIVQQLAEDNQLREKQNILKIKWDQR
ncbi:MAG: P-loop containing nucleoside triphosphate hydrolase, partial [Bacillus sp. (in: firmicutes)]|nr:P-loop containing nucleoside triphosphate hydrolase [Bacillus sp. (in: firmicutes)]